MPSHKAIFSIEIMLKLSPFSNHFYLTFIQKTSFQKDSSNHRQIKSDFFPETSPDGDQKSYSNSLSTSTCSPFMSLLSPFPRRIVRIKQSIYMCFGLSYFHFIHRTAHCARYSDQHTSIWCHLFQFFASLGFLQFVMKSTLSLIEAGRLWNIFDGGARRKDKPKEIIRKVTENDGVDLGFGEACREQAWDLVGR